MLMLYGIKNFDTVKKARKWLDEHGINYRFHDYRTDGLSSEQLLHFAEQFGWHALLNRSSTSWRQLSADQQSALLQLDSEPKTSAKYLAAVQIVLTMPTLLKRPVLAIGSQLVLGFKAENYQLLLPEK